MCGWLRVCVWEVCVGDKGGGEAQAHKSCWWCCCCLAGRIVHLVRALDIETMKQLAGYAPVSTHTHSPAAASRAAMRPTLSPTSALNRFGSSLSVTVAPLEASQLIRCPTVATSSTSLPAAAEVATARTECCRRSCAALACLAWWLHL